MDIIIKRGKTVNLKDLPEWSIAIDGFVQGPKIDSENHKYSFDHHDGCLRFCTLSATQQAWTAIMLGLDAQKYTVYCNDVDSDTCMAIWCLKNPDRCNEPLARKLVESIGSGDMHCGAFHINGMLKTVEWVSAPQIDSIKNGDYEKLSNDGLMTVLESMMHRITQYVNGDAITEISNQELDSTFNIKKNEKGWVLVESNDSHIYSKLYRAGFDRLVIYHAQEDGSTCVTIAKRSDFIDKFPLAKFFKELNKLESGWGGGTTVGGAPRNSDGTRSSLSLDTITEVINAVIDNKKPDTAPVSKKTKKK